MTKPMKALFLILSCIFVQSVFAEETISNGKVKMDAGNYSAWNANTNSWVSIESFWNDFVDQNGGLTWSASKEYPTYSKVKELDTFMVITSKGNCLMEFWHSRWRRANDVRRWDDKFNDYAGCPYVFD